MNFSKNNNISNSQVYNDANVMINRSGSHFMVIMTDELSFMRKWFVIAKQ